MSVVLLSYNGRSSIDAPMRSLGEQVEDEPFEVIVVDSGTDGCHEHVRAAYPWARAVHSDVRLRPGAARNAGIALTRGGCVAFLPVDAVVPRDWVARRVAKHRLGFEAVGGGVAPPRGFHPVPLADYIVDSAGLFPSERTLPRQAVPHCLSYARSLFERFGRFPEDLASGEDTAFNRRLFAAGVAIAFEPAASYRRVGRTSLRRFVRHQLQHGRAAIRAADAAVTTGFHTVPYAAAAYRILFRQPARRWAGAVWRLSLGRRPALVAYAVLSPLVWVGVLARAWGTWSEWLRVRAEAAPS